MIPLIEVPLLCQKCGEDLRDVKFIHIPNQSPETTLDYAWEHQGISYLGYVRGAKVCPSCDFRNFIRKPIKVVKK